MLSLIKNLFQEPKGQILDLSRNLALPAADEISGSIELDVMSRAIPCPMTGMVLPIPESTNPRYNVELREDAGVQVATLDTQQVAALVEDLDSQIHHNGKVVKLPDLDSFTDS